MRPIVFSGLYAPAVLRAYPDLLFVFGDNVERTGKGGQAIIRDEPNAFGVATKRSVGAFFEEGNGMDMMHLAVDLFKLEEEILAGKQIVLPVLQHNGASSLGTGLSELPTRAPTLYSMINAFQRKVLS